jgi:ABC-type multidrug transport system fused ATPase/permease subunit
MVVGNVFKIIGASEKIIKMMQLIPTVNSKGGIILPDNETIGEIELVNVNFHYPTKQDVEVAKGINLKIAKNKVVALVGQSGCGKSSIIALVQRFYDP